MDAFIQLKTILASSPPTALEPVSDLIVSLTVRVSATDRPWFHRAVELITAQLPFCTLFAVFIQRDTQWNSRTLHPALPRTLPGSTMSIETLSLDSVHFPNARTLFRLLASIPSLSLLNLYGATLDALSTANESFVAPHGWQLSEVCSDGPLALGFLLPLLVPKMDPRHAANGRRKTRYLLHADDHHVLQQLHDVIRNLWSEENKVNKIAPYTEFLDILQLRKLSLYDDAEEQWCAYGTYFREGKTAHCFLSDIRCFQEVERGDIEQPFSTELFIHMTLDPPQNAQLPTVVHIDSIHLDFTPAERLPYGRLLIEERWVSFARTTLQLPRLRCLELLHWWNADDLKGSASYWQIKFLFKPLMVVKKFRCRWLTAQSTATGERRITMLQTYETDTNDGSEESETELEDGDEGN